MGLKSGQVKKSDRLPGSAGRFYYNYLYHRITKNKNDRIVLFFIAILQEKTRLDSYNSIISIGLWMNAEI